MPHIVFVHLCQLLGLVEAGHPWPQHLLHAGAHMIPKDADRPFDPLAYRLLLIAPILYRAWAKLRLRHLQPWIATGALPAIFGGIQGIGAAEAWYATSVHVELVMVSRIPLVGGALDLFNFLIRSAGRSYMQCYA